MNGQDFVAFETRIRRLEDMAEICQLISAYGPAADSEDLATMDRIWDEKCVYDIGDQRFDDRAQLKAGIAKFHASRPDGGSAHCGTMPHIVIDGDRAWATHHSALILHESGGYAIARMSASRWTFARQPAGGWLVTSRVNRPLNGDLEARNIFLSTAVAAGGNR